MDALNKKRNAYRSRLAKLQTFINQHNQVPLTIHNVTVSLARLKDWSEAMSSLLDKILEKCKDDTESDPQIVIFDEFDEKVSEIGAKLLEIRESLNPQATPSAIPVKLPNIQVPTFDGKFED